MFNKRGQELSTGTIILLIVGVLILVVLALGFTSGWSKLFPFLSKTNVEQIRTSCNAICTENSAEAYCLSEKDLVSETKKKIKDVTCYYLASYDDEYGIQGCGIDCSEKVYVLDDSSNLKTISDVNQKLNNACSSDNGKYKGLTLQYLFTESKDGSVKRLVSYKC